MCACVCLCACFCIFFEWAYGFQRVVCHCREAKGKARACDFIFTKMTQWVWVNFIKHPSAIFVNSFIQSHSFILETSVSILSFVKKTQKIDLVLEIIPSEWKQNRPKTKGALDSPHSSVKTKPISSIAQIFLSDFLSGKRQMFPWVHGCFVHLSVLSWMYHNNKKKNVPPSKKHRYPNCCHNPSLLWIPNKNVDGSYFDAPCLLLIYNVWALMLHFSQHNYSYDTDTSCGSVTWWGVQISFLWLSGMIKYSECLKFSLFLHSRNLFWKITWLPKMDVFECGDFPVFTVQI